MVNFLSIGSVCNVSATGILYQFFALLQNGIYSFLLPTGSDLFQFTSCEGIRPRQGKPTELSRSVSKNSLEWPR